MAGVTWKRSKVGAKDTLEEVQVDREQGQDEWNVAKGQNITGKPPERIAFKRHL